MVEARFDFDPDDSEVFEAVPAVELLDLLRRFRAKVVEVSP